MLPSIAIHSLNNRSMFERREKGNIVLSWYILVYTFNYGNVCEMELGLKVWCLMPNSILFITVMKLEKNSEFGDIYLTVNGEEGYMQISLSISTNQRYSGFRCWEDVNLTYPIDNGIEQPWDESLWIFDPILLNCHWTSSFLLDLLAGKN